MKVQCPVKEAYYPGNRDHLGRQLSASDAPASLYTQNADRARLARDAIGKLVNDARTNHTW